MICVAEQRIIEKLQTIIPLFRGIQGCGDASKIRKARLFERSLTKYCEVYTQPKIKK